MADEFMNITKENLRSEHLCCIIRSKKAHPGIEAKREWLSDRLEEGHIFRKLNVKGCCFIEYAPLEMAWTSVIGKNYYYIYCLWVTGELRGKGYAKVLLNDCISEAKAKGMSGVCMLGAKKQKNWLSNQAFAKKFGFTAVDATEDGYELLALSFDGSSPTFTKKAKTLKIEDQELTIFYDMQCPFIIQNVEALKEYCAVHTISASFIQIDTLKKAKDLPCVFNNWALFYKGVFKTVNLLDVAHVKKILQK